MPLTSKTRAAHTLTSNATWRSPLLMIAVVLLLVVACTNGSEATATSEVPASADVTSPTATPTPESAYVSPEPTSTEAASASTTATLEVDNVVAHLDALAAEIGIRAAGTDAEREAAGYIAGVLEAAGYETTIETFSVTTRIDGSSLTVAGDDVAVQPLMMSGSAVAEVTAPLIYGALGDPEDLADLDIEGKILLLDRGVIPFGEKARNATLAGAVAVVIANNAPRPYSGNLGDRSSAVAVVAISRAEGALLRPFADSGATATVRASIDSIEAESQNVVGRSGEVCRFYIGSHYDSVPAGPGANDNASGTALVLELARVHRVDGLCVVAFGAEEIGLFGSQAYVADHDLGDALFMLNFDMVGRIDGAIIIGDVALTNVLLPALEDLPIRAGSFPPFASSDHVSFLNAGIPSVTITSGDDPKIHSAGDDFDNVLLDSLATMLEVADRTLRTALAAAG